MREKKVNIICNENINYHRLEYVLDFLNHHPLKSNDIYFELNSSSECIVNISYGGKNNTDFQIPAQKILFDTEKIDFQNLKINEYFYNSEILRSVEYEKKTDLEFIQNQKFAFDIFETIFFHISCIEEFDASPNQIDEHLRMKSVELLKVKFGVYDIPVVDGLVPGFLQALNFEIKKLPTGYTMTHDIDAIMKFNSWLKLPKSIARILLMGKGIKGVKNILKWYYKTLLNFKNDPYFVYDWLFNREIKFENKIVFFVSGGKSKYDLFNKNYLKKLPEIVSHAKLKGYDIGYHPSYFASTDENIFSNELRLLEQINGEKIKWVRTHFLRYNMKFTGKIIEKNELLNDSTFGSNDMIGFRCGTGFPYFLYDFEKESKSKIKELPLVFMDSSLLYFMCNSDQNCFVEKMNEFLNKNIFNTHITFNFHNSTFDKGLNDRGKMRNIYLNLLKSIFQ